MKVNKQKENSIQLEVKKNLLVEAIGQTQFDISPSPQRSLAGCPTWRILHGMAYNGLPAIRLYACVRGGGGSSVHAGPLPRIPAHSAPTIRTAPQRVSALYLQDSRERLGTSHPPFMTGFVGKGTRESVQREKFFRSWVTFFSRLGSNGLSEVTVLLW